MCLATLLSVLSRDCTVSETCPETWSRKEGAVGQHGSACVVVSAIVTAQFKNQIAHGGARTAQFKTLAQIKSIEN